MFTSIASVFVIRIAKNITKLKDVTIVTIFVLVLALERSFDTHAVLLFLELIKSKKSTYSFHVIYASVLCLS